MSLMNEEDIKSIFGSKYEGFESISETRIVNCPKSGSKAIINTYNISNLKGDMISGLRRIANSLEENCKIAIETFVDRHPDTTANDYEFRKSTIVISDDGTLLTAIQISPKTTGETE